MFPVLSFNIHNDHKLKPVKTFYFSTSKLSFVLWILYILKHFLPSSYEDAAHGAHFSLVKL